MKIKYLFNHLPALIVVAFLLFPFCVFLFYFHKWEWNIFSLEIISVLFWTFLQAFLSMFCVIALSLFGARSLMNLTSKKYYPFLEAFIALPSLLPPLILVLSVVQLVEFFSPFPFGFFALVVFQILTYTGLCSVIFNRLFIKELPLLSEWAFVHGLTSLKFLVLVSKTLFKKDIQILCTLVFVGAFTSLSLPLLVSGGKAISLEFFIYEQLKNPELWPLAMSLIGWQILGCFLIYFTAFSNSLTSSFEFHKGFIHLLPSKKFIAIPLFPSCLSFLGLFFIPDLNKNLEAFFKLNSFLLESLLTSAVLGILVGFFVLLFLILMSLSFSSFSLRKFVVSFNYPGVTLLGFAFLLIPFYGKEWIFIKWIAGLSLLCFPVVYRLRGEAVLNQLKDQVEVAQILGGSRFFIFRKILWPQSRQSFFFCSGIAGFLACGDFSYSLIVSQGHWNLALFVYDLFSSYRLNLALLGSWFLLLLSLSVFCFWIGVSFVFDKKFKLHY